jgi:putative ABC transport system permease protein
MQMLVPALTAIGLGLGAGGWLLLNWASHSLPLSFAALFIILMGAALLTPLATRLLMRAIQPLTGRLLGLIGVMAPRDIVRSLSRTAVTIAALMLAVTVIIGVSLMIDSFRGTVSTWLDSILAADIYVSPAGQNLRLDGRIDPQFVTEISQQPAVRQVGLLRATTVFDGEGQETPLRAFSPQPSDATRPVRWAIGPAAELYRALDNGAVMVSEVFARRVGLPLDQPSTLTLRTENGPQQFRVAGVFYDYANPELGYVLMRLAVYRAHWPGDDAITNVGLYLPADIAGDSLSQQLTDSYGAKYRLEFSSNRAIKANALEVFDRTFTITAALRLLATVVAFIGVLSALMSLQLERTRELGTLRANGMSLPQLWGQTLLETGLMGLTAGLMALPTGWLLAFILVHFINLRSFGWTLQMQNDPAIFALAMLVALSAALLAGIYPVIRLSRMEIAAAIRQE